MTLLQLSYYMEVCRAKNFTHAAESLHVTQPTVTNAVRDLEAEFGVKLIQRTNKSFAVTSEGQELYDMALHLLSYAEQIKLIMADKAASQNRLYFGSPLMTSAAGFPELFRLLHQSCPEMEIETQQGLTADLLKKLDNGELQLLLVPYKPSDAKYRYLEWRHSRFLFCVSKSHPLAEKKRVSFSDICHEPLISYFGDVYLTTFNLAQKYLEQGAEPRIVYRCNQIGVMIDLIRNREGCGFLIEGSLGSGSGIVGIPMEEELPVTFYLVWSRDSERYNVVKTALKYLKKSAVRREQ